MHTFMGRKQLEFFSMISQLKFELNKILPILFKPHSRNLNKNLFNFQVSNKKMSIIPFK